MASTTLPRLTPAEYLAIERTADRKSEYLDGETFAMAGASRIHTIIAANIVISLGAQLKGRPGTVHTADLRVKVDETGLYTYPDVVIACGDARYEDEHLDTLLEPTLIVEILSESTEDYDRGRKFSHYRAMPSFREYLLVAQDRHHVEHFVREEDGSWRLTEADRLDDVLELPSIGCRLAVAEVYDKVDSVAADAGG